MRKGVVGQALLTFGLLGAIVLLVALLPVVLPTVAVLEALDMRRRKSDAQRFSCLSCGATLGSESLRLADAAWRAEVDPLQRDRPGVRFRTARDLDAICPNCGQQYRYLKNERAFAPRQTIAASSA